MKPNIIEIDGKYYLELPCLPGDTVYTVTRQIDFKSGVGLKMHYKVFDFKETRLENIVDDLKLFGKSLFTNIKDAEACKEKLEKKRERIVK